MFRRLRSLVADYREFLAEWRKLPTKAKTKGWGALPSQDISSVRDASIGCLSNDEIDKALAEAWDNVPREDVEIWCAEPEPEPEQAA